MTAEEREAEAALLSAAAESGENADADKNGGSAAQKEEIKPEFSRKFILYILKKGFVRYFIDAFTGMAQGLFCTLIAGTILGQIGTWITSAGTDAALAVGGGVTAVANIAKMLMGAGIGIGIAHSLKAPKLVMFTAAVAGLVGAFGDAIVDGFTGGFVSSSVNDVLSGIAPAAPGNPIGSYVVSVLAVELGRQVAGKTKVDIVVVPLVMFVICLFAVWAAWPFIQLVNLIGEGVALATAATPAVMGIVIAAVMGILLTLPTSSAAIWLAVASPVVAAYAAGEVSFATYDAILLAGGAAMVGCSAHMVGFAVQSFRENKWGGLIAQGIGTSMLQIPNLMRHPQIMVPPIIASIIVGPLSTCVFGLRCNAVGGGMGTSGLVGIFGAIDASVEVGLPEWKLALGIVFCCFVIPAVVCFAVSELMRKLGWIKYGDQSLSV
ncbi:MAG TPA: PTS sugar transporter subunit IIC [Candidatus Limadaptatus stercorigallinarum]|uniref:PTS sugar transporter subunit IIC n=1 Tax=Candidatus Limadaptatus stercorigallinarum TaxID=2840845 RepID=A0A9D1L2N4_9FIRM|nr:PTS sugar transporter subunit IIC [Candidatus Limadaptatus stercorigallinarum]